MISDLVREMLERVLAEADDRCARATGQALRPLVGGRPWHDQRVASARADLARAQADRAVAQALLAELDVIDGREGAP